MAIIKPEQLSSGSYSISGSFSGSFQGDGSQLSGIAASKWSGSNPITRDSNVEITGSLNVTGGITASLFGTASWAENALTASYVLNAVSSSFAQTASFTISASFAQTAATASVLNGFDPNAATFTIELIDALTVDFYAPDDLRINTTSSISGSVTASLSVNNSAYTLTNLIDQGDKITVTAVSASVFNLNARYE